MLVLVFNLDIFLYEKNIWELGCSIMRETQNVD